MIFLYETDRSWALGMGMIVGCGAPVPSGFERTVCSTWAHPQRTPVPRCERILRLLGKSWHWFKTTQGSGVGRVGGFWGLAEQDAGSRFRIFCYFI